MVGEVAFKLLTMSVTKLLWANYGETKRPKPTWLHMTKNRRGAKGAACCLLLSCESQQYLFRLSKHETAMARCMRDGYQTS